MSDTLRYNPNDWLNCLVVYVEQKKNPDLKIESTDEIIDMALDKDSLKREDGTYPEVATYLFDMHDTPMKQYLIEGFNLAELDPATDGGKMFWEHVLNSEDLTKKALEEGQAIGKWDTLRQIMNMGKIAYMAKINTVLSFIKKIGIDSSKDAVLSMFDEYYWNNATTLLTAGK